MRAPTDLHPDDMAYRVGLRDMLIERRGQLGYSQARLAKLMHVPQSRIAQFEVGQPQRVAPTQDIAHALGLRLLLFPDGLPGGPYPLPDLDPQLDPQQRHATDRRHMLAALVLARRGCGVTQPELADRLGIHVTVLGRFENNHDGRLMLATCQRYVRALNGELWIGTEPLDPTAVTVSPRYALTGSSAA